MNTYSFEANDDLDKNLMACAMITGRKSSDIITDALKQYLGRYSDVTGKVHVVPATFTNRMEKDPVPQKCYILDETTMMGAPYYKILIDGERIMSVPQGTVKINH